MAHPRPRPAGPGTRAADDGRPGAARARGPRADRPARAAPRGGRREQTLVPGRSITQVESVVYFFDKFEQVADPDWLPGKRGGVFLLLERTLGGDVPAVFLRRNARQNVGDAARASQAPPTSSTRASGRTASSARPASPSPPRAAAPRVVVAAASSVAASSLRDAATTRVPWNGSRRETFRAARAQVTTKYTIDNRLYEMYDVGGQRNERRKWIHCFENVTAVIFVAAISEYNQKLFEDATTNRMLEALEIFEEVNANKFFFNASVRRAGTLRETRFFLRAPRRVPERTPSKFRRPFYRVGRRYPRRRRDASTDDPRRAGRGGAASPRLRVSATTRLRGSAPTRFRKSAPTHLRNPRRRVSADPRRRVSAECRRALVRAGR